MGLDAVEILMEVEETFGISIEDSEAKKMLTPQDLNESVWSNPQSQAHLMGIPPMQ